MNSNEMNELNELVQLIKMYQPLIKACVPLLMEIGSDIHPVIEKAVDASADLQIRFFNRLIDKGMSREEALQTLNTTLAGVVQRGMAKK